MLSIVLIIFETVKLISFIVFTSSGSSILGIIFPICKFLDFASIITSFILFLTTFSFFATWKISSPAQNAPAPIARDGIIPVAKPKYGIAKNVPPQNSGNQTRIFQFYLSFFN